MRTTRGESCHILKGSTSIRLSLCRTTGNREAERAASRFLSMHGNLLCYGGRRETYFFFRMVFSIANLVMTLSTMVMTTVGTNTLQKE